jgi:hypothetical protein
MLQRHSDCHGSVMRTSFRQAKLRRKQERLKEPQPFGHPDRFISPYGWCGEMVRPQ